MDWIDNHRLFEIWVRYKEKLKRKLTQSKVFCCKEKEKFNLSLNPDVILFKISEILTSTLNAQTGCYYIRSSIEITNVHYPKQTERLHSIRESLSAFKSF